VRELSDEDLAVRLRDTRKELFNLRFQHATGQLDNPHKLSVTRREIACLLTSIKQRELDRAAAGGEG
jgi:large subunit ribosomal protein L29